MSYGIFHNQPGSDAVYFAAKPAEDLAGILLSKGDSFFNILRSNNYLDKLSMMYRAYHGAYASADSYNHTVNFTGEEGELVNLPVNHFRNLARHIFSIITANRPIMEARALNTDYKSLAQTYLANGILEYYMREKRLEYNINKAVELAVVFGAGFIKLEWNATAGQTYDVDPDTGEFNYEGELEFSTLSPLDVICDGTKESWNNDWLLVRTFKNRFDLMAKYPEYAERIRGLETKSMSSIYRISLFSNDDTDDIPVYEFYHKPTESMPDGRYMLFLDSNIPLLDTKMPYRVIPIFRVAAGEYLGTPYGYSPMFDIYPLQEAMNSIYGTILTNHSAFGVQNIFMKNGADLSVESLSGGLNIMKGNEPPIPINLTKSSPESFKFLEMLIQASETISGINSVTRGNPEASLKSGTALALVQSMSLQFISDLQQSYVKLVEDVGTAVIQILKDFANTPKAIAIVGKSNRPLLREFTGEQISDINRVIVDVGNPLSRTVAGRVQMADQMLQMHLIQSPQQYFQVINTGRLDSMFEGEMSELMLVKSENERLMEGDAHVQATALDQHKLHIQEHKAVLADPDLRRDPVLVKNALAHIQEHIDLLRNTDPDLLNLIGEQPLPPLQPPAPPPQEPPPMPQGAMHGMFIPHPTNLPPPGMGGPQGPAMPHQMPVPQMMMQGAPKLMPANQQVMTGPGIHNEHIPNLPKVDGKLLPSPMLQQAHMGNVK